MIQAGHNSWLRLNLEKGSSNNLTDPFRVELEIKEPVRELLFNDAADFTANIIATKYTDLKLSLSGGLDSEFVAKVLLRNNIDFTPVMIATDFNQEENWYAYKFCKENNITPHILDYTGPKYNTFLQKLVSYIVELNVPLTIASISNVVASEVSGSLVTGMGEWLNDYTTGFETPIGDVLKSGQRDYLLNLEYGDLHPGGFFCYTPELVRALVLDIDSTKNIQLAKAELYGLLPRPKINFIYTGQATNSPIDAVINNIKQRYSKPEDSQVFTIHKTVLLNNLSI